MKNIRVYALAALPFIAFFAYQLDSLLGHRPEAPDMARGYTIPLDIGDSGAATYISVLDCVLTFTPFLCAAAIIIFGMWRSGAFTRKT